LPSEQGSLSNLQIVFADHNSLTGTMSFQFFAGATNLGAICLHGNQITGMMPKEVGLMTNLHQLFLACRVLQVLLFCD